jgi:RNA polymerase sigma factor (sigma-70 family)
METSARAMLPRRGRRGGDGIDTQTIRMLQLSRDQASVAGLSAASVAEAWRRVYDAYNPLVCAIVRQHSGLRSSREDQGQDIWVEVVSDIGRYDSERGPLAAWIAGVAHNVLCTQGRVRRQPTVLVAEAEAQLRGREHDPADQCEACLARERIAAILRMLQSHISATNYRIFHDRFLGDVSYQEIAISVGLSEKQVRDRYQRTVKQVRTLYVSRRRGT